MNDSIRVLHVVGQMNRGGTETLLMNLLRVEDRSRYQFDFVEQTQNECDYDSEITALGSTIYRCPHISPLNLYTYRMWWRRFFREHPEYRIIHGHSRGSAPIYLSEAKKAGRIAILHCHSNSYGKGISGIIRFLWQIPLYSIADYNLACSHEAGVSQFGQKSDFTVIKNGILSDQFTWSPEMRREIQKEFNIEDAFIIGNVSRFEIPKNHLFLVDIFAEIKKRIPNAKLLLVGRGSMESVIRQRIREKNLVDDVIFTGLRSDVNRLYQAMDVFVFPSLYEGTPLALVEAQTSGLPCFVSNTVAQEVKVSNLLNFISLNQPPTFWAERIAETANAMPERRDRREEIVRAGFDIRSTAEFLNQFYRDVLDHA